MKAIIERANYLFFVSYLMLTLSGYAQTFKWAKSFNGSQLTYGHYSVVDASGNIYTAGSFENTVDFDPDTGVYNLSAISTHDVFISKLDANGNFIWAKTFGSTTIGNDVAHCITLDKEGNVITTGHFAGTVDFDPGIGIHNLTSAGGYDIFISKLDSNGNFILAKKIGGLYSNDYSKHIAIDAVGNFYITGRFTSTSDFDPGPGTYNLTSVGNDDIFISKLDVNLNFVWAKSFGSLNYDFGYSIAVDENQFVYTTGVFRESVDFDPGPSSFSLTSSGDSDIFISKLDSNGNFVWTKQMGGVGSEEVKSLVIDTGGNIYTTGSFSSVVDFNPGIGIYNLTALGYEDIFISKLDINGNFVWAKQMSGTGFEIGSSVFVTSLGYIYVTGDFHNTVDFNPDSTLVSNLTSSGFESVYFLKLDANGNLIWVKGIGENNTNNEYGYSIIVGTNGDIYVVGNITASTDFDPGIDTFIINPTGVRDVFIACYHQKRIHGYIYNDINEDCTKDFNEKGIQSRKAIINPGNIIVETNTSGYWYIDSLSVGTYIATFDTSGHWNTVCPTSLNFNVIHQDSITQAPSFSLFSTQPCASPDITINAPFLRRCFSNQNIYVNACNKNIATGPLNNAYVELELDSLLVPQSASLPYTSFGINKYRFEIGNLNPGMCADFYVSCSLSCAAVSNQTLCMNAQLFPADSCMFDTTSYFPEGVSRCNTQYDGSNLEVTASCYETDHINFEIINTGDGDMTCFSPVRIFIDGQLIQFDSVMLASGDTAIFEFIGDGRTWRLETEQHPKHPGLFFPNATIEACGNIANRVPNMVNILPHDDADPIIDIYCGLVTSSFDPNDKTGYPLGVSSQHYIKPNQPIEYVIRFQNTGNDTAFTVVIRDTLSSDLDIFSVASGVSSHEYIFRMYGSRVLEWTFNNILLPDSNVNEPASNGFVVFTVNQVPDLSNNTVIENSASIYFDYNAPIITNTSQHTINDMLQTPLWTTQSVVNDMGCDSLLLNGFIYNNTGVYYQSIFDTILTINLIVNESPEPVIVQNGSSLSATNTSYTTYEWLLNGQPVGGNDTSYTFNQSGNYSLQVTDSNGCVGTSNSINVTFVGIGNNQHAQFNLNAIPNPFTNATTIQYTLAQTANTTLRVYDVLGKLLIQTKNTHQPQGTHQIQFDNTANGKGIYIIELTVNGSKTLKRIVQVE